MAASVPPRLLLVLCEQGSSGIHPYPWMTMRALMLNEFQTAMWEIKTQACVGD